MVFKAEKTVRLTVAELKRLREEHKFLPKCSKCSLPIIDPIDGNQIVCEHCVKEAMEKEGFKYER